jgi:catechol 2,3-dioxygenase-like lactoylglutathione lyase family enzyme
MKLTSTVLFVANISLSKEFYQNMLQQEIEFDFGTNIAFKSGLSLWQLLPSHPIGQALTTDTTKNNIELYFEHESIAELNQKLKQQGVKFLHNVHEEEWGQYTIRFFDPDNHLIEVGEPMDFFIQRLHSQGMSPNAVSAKSHIPIQTVLQMLGIPE